MTTDEQEMLQNVKILCTVCIKKIFYLPDSPKPYRHNTQDIFLCIGNQMNKVSWQMHSIFVCLLKADFDMIYLEIVDFEMADVEVFFRKGSLVCVCVDEGEDFEDENVGDSVNSGRILNG